MFAGIVNRAGAHIFGGAEGRQVGLKYGRWRGGGSGRGLGEGMRGGRGV